MKHLLLLMGLLCGYSSVIAQQTFPSQMAGEYLCEQRYACASTFKVVLEVDSTDSTRFFLTDSCPNFFSGKFSLAFTNQNYSFGAVINGCTTQGELFPQIDSLYARRNTTGCGSGCSCGLIYKCKKVLSTSQTEHKLEQLKLYPNPVKENLQIDGLQQMVNYRLYNLQGQLVLSGQVSNQASINMLGLVEGLYLLQLSKGEKSVWHKVVKE